MERLTLSRRPKLGDKVECLPDGDILPIWKTIPLDAKFPLLQTPPKGSCILRATQLGEAKYRNKQRYDFDLRDPYGHLVSNEYQPLHDPHLKSFYNSNTMKRQLIRKGFISEDGHILCSLKEFNQYRHYLRHIFFLVIAKKRQEQLEKTISNKKRFNKLCRKISSGTIVRNRLLQQSEQRINKLNKDISSKAERLERRLQEIRDEITRRERQQKKVKEMRQLSVQTNQLEAEVRNAKMIKKFQQRERMRARLMEDRESHRILRDEIGCMEKWNLRKRVQQAKLDHEESIIKHDDEERLNGMIKREEKVAHQRETFQRNFKQLKQQSKEERQKRNELYAKRVEEKMASGDYRIWTRRRGHFRRLRRQPKAFYSTWKLEDVLSTFDISKQPRDRTETTTPKELEQWDATMRHETVEEPGDASKSRSVRFRSTDEAITSYLAMSSSSESDESISIDGVQYKPVSEHILTPCPSQLEIQRLEAAALLGSPEIATIMNSVKFVETLLLRLLDDLNSGRLGREEIMELASFSMDIIQSVAPESEMDEQTEEGDDEGPYIISSASSVIANKLVDFTLAKILRDIKSGKVSYDDLASLTFGLLDSEISSSISVSEDDLDAYISDTMRAATSSAMDPREDSPVCETLLDDFMVKTLKRLIQDLEDETLTKEQLVNLAASVKTETKESLLHASVLEIEDVQSTLVDVLEELKSGAIDLKTLYQIVFAIVYSYNIIKSSTTQCFEGRITDLVRDVLLTIEQQAAANEIEHVNVNIVHEANRRLSKADLDVNQIEKLSSSIINVVGKADVICRTSTSEIARSIVEDVLTQAREQLESRQSDDSLILGVQNIAEALICIIPYRDEIEQPESPPLVEEFVAFLNQLKATAEESGTIENSEIEQIKCLIDHISARIINANEVHEIALSVVRTLKSPVKSQSSFEASLAVGGVLKIVHDNLVRGSLEDSIVRDMITTLTASSRAMRNVIESKSPVVLHALSSFLKTVLGHITHKVECGEFNEHDIIELSQTLTCKKAENIFDHLNKLLDEMQTGELNFNDVQDLGIRLVEYGNKLKESLSKKSSHTVAGDVVDDVIKTLQMEIDSGMLTKESLDVVSRDVVEAVIKTLQMEIDSGMLNKESLDVVAGDVVEAVIKTLQMEIDIGMLTKESLEGITQIITSTSSDSHIASEVVEYTIKGIHEDIEREHHLTKLSSIPNRTSSPSASSIASNIILYTIEKITRDIEQNGIQTNMTSSIASSLVSTIREDTPILENLPQEFEKVRKTVKVIVDCLRQDQINQTDAERIFCVILENYKTFVLGKEAPTPVLESLSDDAADLVDMLVGETLRNVERSIKRRPMDKAFSIPSMSHSKETSEMAEEWIDECLQTIKRDLSESQKMPHKTDISDFVLDIVTGLQAELEEGTISNLAMAHFIQSISSENVQLKTLEENAAFYLNRVLVEIQRHRSSSEYVHRILESYLIADQASDELFSDPVKAIESILISVSSEILIKFVRATLQNILIEMREGSGSITDRLPSAYALRSTSVMIAENVVHEVLRRIKHDMTQSVHRIHEGASKQQIDKAASRLLSDYRGRVSAKCANKPVSPSKPNIPSVLSKEVENIVLETIHNVVSNLMLEQSMHPKNEPDEIASVSHAVQDFVLQTLQVIVTDLQDKRSLAELDVSKTEDKYGGSTTELTSGESREAATYVNEVLHTVLEDMKIEMKSNEPETLNDDKKQHPDTSCAESVNLKTLIVECLINAIADSNIPIHPISLEPNQLEDVRKIFTECIKGTIYNVREKKFSDSEIQKMHASLMNFLNETDSNVLESEMQHTISPERVIHLLEIVLNKVEVMGLDEHTLIRISTQLATLGMDTVEPDRKSPNTALSEASVASSCINDLITDVVTRIFEQLNEEIMGTHDADSTNPISDALVDKLSTASNESQQKKDVNYNRRLSAASSGTQSMGLAWTSDSSDKNVHLNKPYDSYHFDINASDSKGTQADHRVAQKNTIKTVKNPTNKKKLTGRSNEPLSLRKNKLLPSNIGPAYGKNVQVSSNRKTTVKNISDDKTDRRTILIQSYIDLAIPKTHKKDKDIGTSKRPVNFKASSTEKKNVSVMSTNHKMLAPVIMPSAPMKKLGSNSKKQKRDRVKAAETKQRNPKSPELFKKSSRKLSTPLEPRVGPFELKSVCGAHKARIRLRDNTVSQSSNADNSTVEEGSGATVGKYRKNSLRDI